MAEMISDIPSDIEDEETPILQRDHFISNSKKGNPWYFYYLVFFASMGGFIFGYDTGVISGAMIPLKRVFNLNDVLQEIIVAIAIAGAIAGAVLSGILNDKLGRRPVLLIESALFTIGSVILGVANGITALIIGRVVVGLGIGLASMTVPIYVAEAAPPLVRGQVVTTYQLFITAGQFIASVMNGAFSYLEKDGWRYMLGVPGVASLIMFLGCLFVPESPRWLIRKGKIDEARKGLQSIRGDEDIDKEFQDIVDATAKESTVTLSDSLKKIVTTSSTRRALVLGCGLQAIQQLSAINTVMYYSASIIQLAGVTEEKLIIWLAAVVAFGNCFFTLISFFVIEKVGRRKLTLSSVFGVVIALCLLAVTFFLLDNKTPRVTYKAPVIYTKNCLSFQDCSSCVFHEKCGFCYAKHDYDVINGSCLAVDPRKDRSRSPFCNSSLYEPANNDYLVWSPNICPSSYAWLAVCSMIVYLAMFAPGLGPMPWTINAEIYPLWARNACMSASTSTNWIMNLLVSLTFLSLMEYMTRPGAFILYAVLTFLGFIFLYFLLPETKGKKLEEMEKLFERSPNLVHSHEY